MRTTTEIKDKLTNVELEIRRISERLLDNGENYKEPYTFKNGTQHPEWDLDDALTSSVAIKNTLKWVLNSNL